MGIRVALDGKLDDARIAVLADPLLALELVRVGQLYPLAGAGLAKHLAAPAAVVAATRQLEACGYHRRPRGG